MALTPIFNLPDDEWEAHAAEGLRALEAQSAMAQRIRRGEISFDDAVAELAETELDRALVADFLAHVVPSEPPPTG